MSKELTKMGDVIMKCQSCGSLNRIDDCEPDIDGDGSRGCPITECGGTMGAVMIENA